MKIKKRHIRTGAILAGALLMVSFFLLASGGKATGNTPTGDAPAALGNEGLVKISLSGLSNAAQFYEYDDNGVKINYFAVLGSDGKPRTAFDACDVCGGYKGYQQKGNDIECRNCGRVFSIDGLGTKNKGYGCWPTYLPHDVNGDDILIKASDLKKERPKFA